MHHNEPHPSVIRTVAQKPDFSSFSVKDHMIYPSIINEFILLLSDLERTETEKEECE